MLYSIKYWDGSNTSSFKDMLEASLEVYHVSVTLFKLNIDVIPVINFCKGICF